MDAIVALERIVYLLDRSLAPQPKVKAFLRAADIVRETPPGELATLHREGRLQELPGIGDSTGRAIAEALDGQEPGYLRKLEETTDVPIGEGKALRSALKGDCHTHSEWSDGGASIETMARAAMALGHDYIVLTDHSARLTIAHGLSADRLREQLKEVSRLNEELAPFRILTGMEVDILEDGTLDMTSELLGQLDVVVASVHRKLSMPEREMTVRMVKAMANPHTDILGHCTGRQVPGHERPIGKSSFRGRPQSRFDPEIVFAACARFDKAVEINCRPERQDPPDELLQIALGWGCKISIDTDAHAPGQLEWQALGCDKAARAGVEPDEIVNTWDADELVAWATGHPTD